jgi:pyridoxine 5-phosphate synthase
MRLGVNIDHVATVREARRARQPDPVTAALLAEEAGADQITAHLREDRRHIQDRDIRLLRELVQTRLNLELASTDEMIAVALSVRPDSATLVPEKREELTTEGGLNVRESRMRIHEAVTRLQGAGIRTSLFIDPDQAQVEEAKRVGAEVVELHTGRYAGAGSEEDRDAELERIADSAALAVKMGLEAVAGHGLDYRNVGRVAALRDLTELNIGHAIVSRAVIRGIGPAVAEMVALIRAARAGIAAP